MPRLSDGRKRILVTGGAGFLGSHLTDRLLDQGHEVLCVDNLFTGSDSPLVHEDLPQDDPRQRKPDIGQARQVLGSEPKIRLDECLARTIADFRPRVAA